MNPFRWTREHQLAWLVTCLLGAVVGLFIGFVVDLERSAGTAALSTGWYFSEVWIQAPGHYWPWPTFGAVIVGLGTYAMRLWRISN